MCPEFTGVLRLDIRKDRFVNSSGICLLGFLFILLLKLVDGAVVCERPHSIFLLD